VAADDVNQRLSRISTLWSVVCQAHDGPADVRGRAQRELFERYGGAVRRYLRRLLTDEDAAEDLFQEFALRLVHGDLRGADPGRGRFRHFVKGVLFHLVADHHQRQRRRPRALPADYAEPAVGPPTLAELDRDLVAGWRDELLARSWAALAAVERQSGQPFHTVLRLRTERPGLASPQLAEELGARLGKPFTAAGARQTLHRAREKFADLLIDEAVHSLHDPTPEQLEQELSELGLLDYCRPRLERRARKG
jgi:RNA polymerase sigma-70 factor (ECF subfamily)